MKKFTAGMLMFLSIAFISCSKDQMPDLIPVPDPVITKNSITATIDGTPVTFDTSYITRKIEYGDYIWDIFGIRKTANSVDTVYVSFFGPDMFKTGLTYFEYYFSPSAGPSGGIGQPDTADGFYEQNASGTITVYWTGQLKINANPFQALITTLTDKFMQGTFSGDLYFKTSNGTLNKKSITDGKFSVVF